MTDYLASYYDLESPEIASATDELSLWAAPFGLRLLDTVRYKQSMKALDIGFGSGFPLIELSMRLGKSSEVYGIDLWKAGVARAEMKLRKYGLTNVHIVEGMAENLPFADNFFDLIVSNNGLNNVADITKTLSEVSRVAKTGTQFVFTFNTDRTFPEFYSAYRETLYELGIPEFNKRLHEHIFEKRKPVIFLDRLVRQSGFSVNTVRDDMFYLRYADGTAMLNHFFIKLAFLESWRNIVPPAHRERLFRRIEERLNDKSKELGGLKMEVPFVVFDCEKR